MNIDSTNIQPDHWVKIVEVIRERYSRYDGFVITHGTDTMAYTAAMLSYMIQNGRKPVIITGSQKPMEDISTDAVKNLMDSIRFACENIGGVYIVFSSSVINGCRAVKVRTRSNNAFESINYPYVADIDHAEIKYNPEYTFSHNREEVRFFESVATDIVLIKLIPGVRPEIFDYVKGKYRGIVIESFGSGGVPFIGDESILSKVESLVHSGMLVVITTQCLFEGGNLYLYEVGLKLSKSRLIPALDMTTESAVCKLMWALGQTADCSEAKELFLKPVNNDFMLNVI